MTQLSKAPPGAALLLAANAEVEKTDQAVYGSQASKEFKRAWNEFAHAWRRQFEEMGRGTRALSSAEGRQVVGFRTEARSWAAAFNRDKRAGFPRPLHEMGAWEAGVRDEDDLGALVYTPSAIKAELDTVKAGADQLDRDITASKVRDEFKQAWRAFLNEWRAYYKDHEGYWSHMWFAVYEKAVEYRKRVDQWREAFQTEGGRVSAPTLTPPSDKGSGTWKWVALGAGALLVTGAVISRRVVP
jgi:hypothetical protein